MRPQSTPNHVLLQKGRLTAACLQQMEKLMSSTESRLQPSQRRWTNSLHHPQRIPSGLQVAPGTLETKLQPPGHGKRPVRRSRRQEAANDKADQDDEEGSKSHRQLELCPVYRQKSSRPDQFPYKEQFPSSYPITLDVVILQS